MPFESLGAVSYSPFIVTIAVSVAVYEIFNVKEWRDSKNSVTLRTSYWMFKVTENGAVRLTICDCLLVGHCNYSSIVLVCADSRALTSTILTLAAHALIMSDSCPIRQQYVI